MAQLKTALRWISATLSVSVETCCRNRTGTDWDVFTLLILKDAESDKPTNFSQVTSNCNMEMWLEECYQCYHQATIIVLQTIIFPTWMRFPLNVGCNINSILMVFCVLSSRYLKGEDKDNWISIDQTTADIRLNKLPDRESKYLINGTYYAKIICVSKGSCFFLCKIHWGNMELVDGWNAMDSLCSFSDSSQKTATGTIAIQVEDSNDHCPTLVHPTQTVCFEENVDHVVYVTAVDGDAFPNGAPFDFKITSSTTEQWSVERLLGNGKKTYSIPFFFNYIAIFKQIVCNIHIHYNSNHVLK